MRLRYVLPALALALVTAGAEAQVGVYLNPVVTRISDSTPDNGPFSFLGSGVTSRTFGGLDFGGYYDLTRGPGAKLGIDVRDTIVHANKASLNTFSVGGRIESAPIVRGIRPYAEVLVGAGRSKAEQTTIHSTGFAFGIFGGLDLPLNRHVDFRVVELGYGSVTIANSSMVGQPPPIPAARQINVSSGLVFRFGVPGGPKKEKSPY